MDSLYFAYGSNLRKSRMQDRVPSAKALGCACLAGYRLTLDKRSLDGSGKANLHEARDERVYGALYRIRSVHWDALDTCEPGYQRVEVAVVASNERHLKAWTYVSSDLTPDPVAYEWYKRLIVDGAAEHGLPPAWQQFLEDLPARPEGPR